MIQVTLYSRTDCHLCHQVQADLGVLQAEFPHQLTVVDVDQNPTLQNQYGFEVPVVAIGALILRAPITASELRRALAAAGQTTQSAAAQTGRPGAQSRPTWTRSDSISYWLSRHYLAVLNSLLALYIFLPFFAPVLLEAGYFTPASLIYRMYGATCHQLAFRSFFLFGEQAVYPRQSAGLKDLLAFQQASGINESNDTADILAARNFTGNPAMGFKVALCERDIALYGSILLFGLLFALSGRRIPPIPWYIWVIFGLVPIGLDGLSQLFSQPPFNFIPYRESTPILRVITGALFGFMTAWFGLPIVEQTMVDTRQMLETKRDKVRSAQPVRKD